MLAWNLKSVPLHGIWSIWSKTVPEIPIWQKLEQELQICLNTLEGGRGQLKATTMYLSHDAPELQASAEACYPPYLCSWCRLVFLALQQNTQLRFRECAEI